MIEAATINPELEKKLLEEWFETVQFDVESKGIPELEPENDDEPPESRSLTIESGQPHEYTGDLSNTDMETLLAELRKRDPDNPF